MRISDWSSDVCSSDLPHAPGLAIPLVTAISTTIGARNGLLVRDRRGLEEARLLHTVVFDKPGTLTLGSHRVVKTTAAAGLTGDDVLRVAPSVQRDAEHPPAQALMTSAKDHGIEGPLHQEARRLGKEIYRDCRSQ